MKTAISISDKVFHAAEELAERLKVSRSALYAAAIADYVARRTGEQITARLDVVYGAEGKGVTSAAAERPPISRADHW